MRNRSFLALSFSLFGIQVMFANPVVEVDAPIVEIIASNISIVNKEPKVVSLSETFEDVKNIPYYNIQLMITPSIDSVSRLKESFDNVSVSELNNQFKVFIGPFKGYSLAVKEFKNLKNLPKDAYIERSK